jgi:hypothetical protein
MDLKHPIKFAAASVAPDTTLRLLSIRSRRLIERQAVLLGLDELARCVSRHVRSRVASGPFKGTVLDYEALPVHTAPKLLGTYEKEIASFIEDAIVRRPKNVVNIGTSDGYYAVGLARRLPEATIFASDADPKSLAATMRNAELNAVADRLVPIGILHPGGLGGLLKARHSLVIMDCEGAEFELLDPKRDPSLVTADIIVEIHEDRGDPLQLAQGFTATHTTSRALRAARIASDMPIDIPGVDPLAAMDERRSEQSWLYLRTKHMDGALMSNDKNCGSLH